jgi:hypothetical protein
VTTAEPIVLDGRYILGDLLGSGGMAQVFRARDAVLDRAVAVKVFHQGCALPDADVRRGGEVRLLAGLSHPGLVMVFDAGRDTSNPLSPFAYLVMELVDGTTLARELDGGPLEPQRTATIGAQLASALAYVHERGVVHRDIKPANVLMGGGGSHVAKLTDFGVARLVDSTRLTVHGTTLGTANYLSPEQTTGGDVGPASDVYSLALVLLECLTGQVAFPGYGVEAALARLHRAPTIPAQLDPAWRELLAAMTASAAADRPAAGEVAARLSALTTPGIDSAAATTITSLPVAADAAPRRRRRVVWLAAALVAAITTATIAVMSNSGTATPAAAAVDTASYPHAAGKLGHDLRTLESVAPSSLRRGVTTVARHSAVRDFHGAQQALSRVLDQLGAQHGNGAVDDALNAKVATAIAVVSADLMRGQIAVDAAISKAKARAAARARARATARAAAAARVAARDAAHAAARQAALERARLAAARRAAQVAARAHAEWSAQHRAVGPVHAHGSWSDPKPAHGPDHADGPGPAHGPGSAPGPGDH